MHEAIARSLQRLLLPRRRGGGHGPHRARSRTPSGSGRRPASASTPRRRAASRRDRGTRCATAGQFRVGFTLNMAIGEGDVTVTPLQLALAYAALGNGGTLYQPQIVRAVETSDGAVVQEFPPRDPQAGQRRSRRTCAASPTRSTTSSTTRAARRTPRATRRSTSRARPGTAQTGYVAEEGETTPKIGLVPRAEPRLVRELSPLRAPPRSPSPCWSSTAARAPTIAVPVGDADRPRVRAPAGDPRSGTPTAAEVARARAPKPVRPRPEATREAAISRRRPARARARALRLDALHRASRRSPSSASSTSTRRRASRTARTPRSTSSRSTGSSAAASSRRSSRPSTTGTTSGSATRSTACGVVLLAPRLHPGARDPRELALDLHRLVQLPAERVHEAVPGHRARQVPARRPEERGPHARGPRWSRRSSRRCPTALVLLAARPRDGAHPGARLRLHLRAHAHPDAEPRRALGVGGAILAPVFWSYGLRGYQNERITALLNPNENILGYNWDPHQARIAVGNGGWLGQGFMRGSQNQFLFLPRAALRLPVPRLRRGVGASSGASCSCRSTRLLVLWCLRVASTAKDRFGAVLAIGVGSIVFWHAVFNLGMVTGLLPVVGVTLPLFSYGGSSVMTILIGVGPRDERVDATLLRLAVPTHAAARGVATSCCRPCCRPAAPSCETSRTRSGRA